MELYFILMILVALFVFIIGLLLWKKQKVNLIHGYQLKNIKDLAGYSSAMGKALCILGIFLAINTIMNSLPFIPANLTSIIQIIGLITIIVLMYSIQKKYSGH